MSEERTRRSERERNNKYRYESSHEERTMEPETRNGIVSGAARVNVRRTPEKTDDNVDRVLNNGDQVKIIGEAPEPEKHYYKIRLDDGSIGYILKKYCKEV